MNNSNVIIVFCQVPNETIAKEIATDLLDARLAACVTLQPNAYSLFYWENTLEQTIETMLLIKTTKERYIDLERIILNKHPYDTPEIIALPIVQGLPSYLAWVTYATQPPA